MKTLPEKNCSVCQRPFQWRKKWEKNWDEVKYCSKRCQGDHGNRRELSEDDLDRIIRMAWEDRTPFEAILAQFGLNESQTIEVMRRSLPSLRFRAWRKRVHEHGNLKDQTARGFKVGVFKSRKQRLNGTLKG